MLQHNSFLFLAGHRKSGTSMFLNLFDSHPSLAVFPSDINLLYAYFPVYTDGGYSSAQRLARLERVLFDDYKTYPDIAQSIDLRRFQRVFMESLADADLTDVCTLLERFAAAFQTLGNWPTNAPCVLKETSLEIYAQMLAECFPTARFIHLVRDPRDNYASIRAGLKRYATMGDDEHRLLFGMITRGRQCLEYALRNREILGQNIYRIVRFEDVVTRPREIMGDLCDWLGLEFHPCLLRPTVFGRPTRGNSYDDLEMYDISRFNLGRWPERIREIEAQVVEYYLGNLMDTFGYQRAFSTAQCCAAASEHYKWYNYSYLYFDRFQEPDRLPEQQPTTAKAD